MEELYINDKRIDLGDATVTLNHKGNFNGDLSTIQASNSQTIQVPKTARNRAALGCPDIPSYQGGCLRRYNDARFFRNGVELFRGFAVLLSAGEDFELCLSWGTLSALTDFLNQDDSLNEYLDDGTFIEWNATTHNNSQYGGWYRNGYADEPDCPLHPSVYVSEILSRIQEKSGLAFKFPADATSWLADKKVLCIGNANSKKAIEKKPTTYSFVTIVKGAITLEIKSGNGVVNGNGGIVVETDEQVDEITFSLNEVRLALTQAIEGDLYINVINGEKTVASFKGLKMASTGFQTFLFNTSSTIPYEEGYYTLRLNIDATPNSVVGTVSAGIKFHDNEGATGELPYPGYFPVFINLPDIKLADFMKDIAALTGTFPHRNPSDPANQITFSPFDILYDNKPKAVDWSDKLLYKGAPQEMEYQYGDMAQRNWLQYAESEDTPVSRGLVTVVDETLEGEKELYTLSFAATETYPSGARGVAVIKMYEKGDDGTWEYNGTDPRILSTSGSALSKNLGFSGLPFGEIVAASYQGYQRIFGQPVVLREDFRLTEVDLRDVDFTVPVYLRQYGRFYAIIQIQDTDGICKVELLQLN